MRPIRVEGAKDTYRGPVPEIADLPGSIDRVNGLFTSVLRLTDEERAQIAAGGNVELTICSLPIPPVALGVTQAEEVFTDGHGSPDFRCQGPECGALYVDERATDLRHRCGQCGGELRPTDSNDRPERVSA